MRAIRGQTKNRYEWMIKAKYESLLINFLPIQAPRRFLLRVDGDRHGFGVLVGTTRGSRLRRRDLLPAPAPVVQKKAPWTGKRRLGGGAARGFAHVGVIQVLEEAGIFGPI